MAAADRFTISTDPSLLDLELVHRWLSEDAYWAIGRSLETVRKAAAGSINLAALDANGRQCGYARIVTDRATFAWVCDVYVEPQARGLGVGGQLARAVVDLVGPMDLKRVMLSTRDAHGVYERVGFARIAGDDTIMMLGGPR